MQTGKKVQEKWCCPTSVFYPDSKTENKSGREQKLSLANGLQNVSEYRDDYSLIAAMV
jgi:hypothetical protein